MEVENKTHVEETKTKETKKNNKKTLWIILAVIVGILVICAIATAVGASRFLSNIFNRTEETVLEQTVEDSEDVFVDEDEAFFDVPELQSAVLGEELDFGHYTVTITKVEYDYTDNILDEDQYKYVTTEILVKNTSDQPLYHTSDWTLYDEDGYDYSTYSRKEPRFNTSANVQVNGTTRGWLNFRTLKDAENFTLQYTTSGYDSDYNWITYTAEIDLGENIETE